LPRDYRLDDVDTQLIALLRENGRATNRELAARLDLAEPTVRARIRRLADAKVMRVVALTDFRALGYDFYIMLWIRVEGRSAQDVAQDLARLPRVLAVSLIVGSFDIWAVVIARGKDDLADFSATDLGQVSGIRDVEGVLALEILRYNSEWGPPLPPSDRLSAHLDGSAGLDRIDAEIIEVLREDGRASNREVARQVGVSEGTVRARLRRLEESGTVRIMAVTNPLAVGLNAWTPVGLRVERDKITEVAAALQKLDNLTLVARTFGMFDMVVVALVPTRDDLLRLLTDEIGRIPGVRRTETSEAIRVVKYNYTLARID
jgi:DNA-binding Lrp family transcriptional regulator